LVSATDSNIRGLQDRNLFLVFFVNNLQIKDLDEMITFRNFDLISSLLLEHLIKEKNKLKAQAFD
jgi:hypothetical protein